jgi:hypothetical protein
MKTAILLSASLAALASPTLAQTAPTANDDIVVTANNREQGLQEPFVYLKPAGPLPAGEELPVLVSPLLPDSDRVVVGYLSGTSTSIQPDQLPNLLTQPRSTDHD